MREILFRGKRTDNGEWVEGYLTRRPSAIQYEAHYSPWFIDKPPSDPDDNGGFYNVDRETVGQFTGLIDRNGKRIFEGDIVKCFDISRYRENEFISVVEFWDGSWLLRASEDYGVYLYNYENSEGVGSLSEIKVIGNIHDNPELLNDEREGRE